MKPCRQMRRNLLVPKRLVFAEAVESTSPFRGKHQGREFPAAL